MCVIYITYILHTHTHKLKKPGEKTIVLWITMMDEWESTQRKYWIMNKLLCWNCLVLVVQVFSIISKLLNFSQMWITSVMKVWWNESLDKLWAFFLRTLSGMQKPHCFTVGELQFFGFQSVPRLVAGIIFLFLFAHCRSVSGLNFTSCLPVTCKRKRS